MRNEKARKDQFHALEIASFIVQYCKQYNKELTHLKLQKLIYFMNLNWLKSKNYPLIVEDIEKWRLGPVVPEVYFSYNGNGSGLIEEVPTVLQQSENGALTFKKTEPPKLNQADEVFLERVLLKLADLDAYDLVERTHEHEAWKKDELRINKGEKKITYTLAELISETRPADDKEVVS